VSRRGFRAGRVFRPAAAGARYAAAGLLVAALLAPRLQLIGSCRDPDRGAAANPGDSGYRRLLLAPAIAFAAAGLNVDAQVALPVFQDVRGNQLVSPGLFKLHLSRRF